MGDACDPDDDNDGIADTSDNCVTVPNASQIDFEGYIQPNRLVANASRDGIGDQCDPDDDNDSVADTVDNCPLVANTNQTDTDAQGGLAFSTDNVEMAKETYAIIVHW